MPNSHPCNEVGALLGILIRQHTAKLFFTS
nr:MAG TPA: hypothetical protein [Bacteriophage sp.]